MVLCGFGRGGVKKNDSRNVLAEGGCDAGQLLRYHPHTDADMAGQKTEIHQLARVPFISFEAAQSSRTISVSVLSKAQLTSFNQISTSAEKERKRNDLKEGLNSTKTFDELNEQEAELQRKNEEDQAIINNNNTSPSEREAAKGRVAKRNEEIARLQTQIEERERALPLRERIKEIFKKHDVPLTAILLAAGVTTGSVIGAITNALKATSKALGNGLKEISKKKNSFTSARAAQIDRFIPCHSRGTGHRVSGCPHMAADFGRRVLHHGIIHLKAALTPCQEQQPCNRNRANCKGYFVVFVVSHCRTPLVALVQVLFGQQALALPLFGPPAFFCSSGLTDGCLAGLSLIFFLPCGEKPLFLCSCSLRC